MPQAIRVVVNGRPHEVAAEPDRSLLSVVRDELTLTGTKYACLQGECGACTVLVDGEPRLSCTTHAAEVDGRSVTTIEGLALSGRLHPAQQGFLEEQAFQCGFCTAGQIMSAAALIARTPDPDDEALRVAMDRNVCRCGTYPRIVRAVRRAAQVGREGTSIPLEDTGRWPGALDMAALRPARPWDTVGADEREYFELLGEGLVVVLPPEETARSGGGGEGAWTARGGAWLHVGADGSVTAFTGKVDVGQDNRTALTMIVADALATALATVRLVMGDTDLCPFDLGTFGSRSMPDAGPNLRAAASTARDVLLRLAAARWRTRPGDLEALDGRVVRGDGQGIAYGDLVRGMRRLELARAGAGGAPGPATGHERAAASGTRRITSLDIVTGRHPYVIDMARPRMLTGLVVRPPSLRATCRRVDLSAARAMPGVVAIAEGDFIAVAAPDAATARAARGAVAVEWNEHPGPSEAAIVEHLRTHHVERSGWEGGVNEERGDVDRALASAGTRLEQTYTAAYIAHVPLETRDAMAEWVDGRLTVWTATQRPFGVREELARALGVAEADVRVIVPDAGGGFGGKHTGEAALEAARLARAAGRPVKVRWSRAEEMTWAYVRPFAVIDVRAGLAVDGAVDAWEFVNLNSGANALASPYAVPNRRERFMPAASPLRVGSYRALAATANTFARESAMDELAEAAGSDPLEFRLRNLDDERLAAVFRAAADRAGWGTHARGSGHHGDLAPHAGHGMGIAGTLEKGGRIATVAEVRVDPDGTFHLLRLVSAFECGAIVNPTGLANQIEGAAVMGLGGALFEAVHFADGRILTPTLKEYRVPRMRDVPPIEVVLVDRPDQSPAGGGETPIVAVAPAIANAIHAATGVRLRSMPLVPDGKVPLGVG